jgi:hypothetical protein
VSPACEKYGESNSSAAETEMTKDLRQRVVDFFSNAPVDILPHLGHRRGKDEVLQMWSLLNLAGRCCDSTTGLISGSDPHQ